MRFKKIMKLFDAGNVSVAGLRGRGKDVLMSNVYVRNKRPYVCNVDYGGNFIEYFDIQKFNVNNTYKNFLSGDINYYKSPYPDGTDVLLSDCGIYYPSQYNASLDNKYGFFSTWIAISRHTQLANFHHNSQSSDRVWNKIREQSDIFLKCNFCRFPFARTNIPWLRDVVIQKVTIYSKYQSFVDNVPPYRAPRVHMNTDRTFNNQLEKQRYTISYGDIKSGILIFRNKSKFDTRFFRTLLLNGKKPDAEETPELPIEAPTQ